MKLNINDVIERRNMKNIIIEHLYNTRDIKLYLENGVFSRNNAKECIRNWTTLSTDTNIAFNKALDAFEEFCYNSNSSDIKSEFRYLYEGMNKVRDSNSLMNSIKYKNSRLKTKVTTKIQNKIDNITNALPGISHTIANALSGGLAKVSTPGVAKDSSDTTNECFAKLLDKAENIVECDRILNNYDKVSRNFDIDAIAVYNESDVYQTCFDIASCIDRFNISFKAKYNSALECCKYVLESHYIPHNNYTIMEAVTDYFNFTREMTDNYIEDIKSLRENSILFSKEDFDTCNYLWETAEVNKSIDYIDYENYSSDILEVAISKIDEAADNKKDKDFMGAGKAVKTIAKDAIKNIKDNVKGNPDERKDKDAKKLIDDFRKDVVKDKNATTIGQKLKRMVSKFFSQSPKSIIYGLPSLFSLIRAMVVIFMVPISIIFAVLMAISIAIIKLSVDRKEFGRIITAYKNEIKAVNKKIDTTKNDKEKKNLEKYRDHLKEDLEKLQEYDRDNYTERENDERGAWSYDDDDSDMDFGFDDDWGDLEEATKTLTGISMIESSIDKINEALIDDDIDGTICNKIFNLSNDDLVNAAEFICTIPVMHEKNKLYEALIEERDRLRKLEFSVYNGKKIDALNEAIRCMKNSQYLNTESMNLKDAVAYLNCVDHIVSSTNENAYIVEMNIKNTFALICKRLKNATSKLSDKEKKVSATLDATADGISKSIQQALMANNREAVIKGSVIPKFSKLVKYAITFATAGYIFNPVVSVIGAVGTFFCMKKMQNKERELIIDEIDLELTMVDKYIKRAEDKDDLKKLREYEKIKRQLQRQKNRIMKKMQLDVSNAVLDKGYDDD